MYLLLQQEFFNCAEITIRPGGPPSPPPPTPTVPTPPPSPTTENTIQIQADNYLYMQGVQIEDTSDVKGGKNVGYIDTGDWMSYPEVTILSTGTYRVEYRVACAGSGGSLRLEKAGGTQEYAWLVMSATCRRHVGDMAKCRLFSSRQGKFGNMWFLVCRHTFVSRFSDIDVSRTDEIRMSFLLIPT